MNLRSLAESGITALLILLVVAMLIGQQLGQPIVLGFVLTGSMNAAPANMAPGDGFIAVPPSLAGDIEQNDVVTFEAQQLQGGGLTTHRIVGETDQGYITRGDANPFTDQDGSEPPVQESQIKAVALQLGGDTVVIPQIGLVVLALQDAFAAASSALSQVPGLGGLAGGNAGSLMVLIGLLLLGYSVLAEAGGETTRRPSRNDQSRDRRGQTSAVLVLIIILLLITVPATASMLIPSGTDDITIVSSQTPSSDPTVIERGGSVEYTYNFTNDGAIPRIATVTAASTGVDVAQPALVAERGKTASTIVTIHAPEETGAYVRSVSEWQYVRFLPIPVILSLHAIHPFAAVAGINAVIITTVTAVYVFAVGLKPFRFRNRDRELSLSQRLRRVIRRWR